MMNKLEGLCDRLWACAQWHEESAAELVGFGHEQHIRFATLLREAAAELKAARVELQAVNAALGLLDVIVIGYDKWEDDPEQLGNYVIDVLNSGTGGGA